MAAILSELRDIKELSPEYQKIIKTIHVNYQPAVSFLVTIYNLVSSYGDNTNGILGHGHCQPVIIDSEKPQFKKILYKFELIEFFVGNYCVFARSNLNEIFAWGSTVWHQIGKYQDELTELENTTIGPTKFQITKDEYITKICCPTRYCIALSLSGSVFEWGYNVLHKKGIGPKFIDIPRLFKIESCSSKFKDIECEGLLSFAITEEGKAFLWGSISEDDRIYPPIELKQSGIRKLILSKNLSEIFAFTLDDKIFKSQNLLDNFQLESCDMKIKGLDYCDNELLVQTEDSVMVLHDQTLWNTYYLNFSEYRLMKYHSLDRTIHIENSDKILEFFKTGYFPNKNFYEDFSKREFIASGRHKVYKVVPRSAPDQEYAVKEFTFEDQQDKLDKILKEIRLMSQLSSEFIMKIKTAWIQKDIFIDNGINTYIQMELGLCDLSRFINIQNNVFTKTNCPTLSPTRYEISIILFEQMLESLHYIHNDKRLGQFVSVERWLIGE